MTSALFFIVAERIICPDMLYMQISLPVALSMYKSFPIRLISVSSCLEFSIPSVAGSTASILIEFTLFEKNSIKIISGDNPITVSEVSRRVGVKGAEKYISLEGLNEQQKQIIYYRYFEDMTQSKVAALLGVSQMQVSRLEKAALQKIKDKMHVL